MTAARKARFLAWLRRTHGWLGLWGAAMGLMFGLTGIIQNHRAILPMHLKKAEKTVAQVAVEANPVSANEVGRKLQLSMGFAGKPMRVAVEPAGPVVWNGQSIQQPERWQFWFESPQRYARVEYFVGNRFAKVEKYDANLIATVVRLHQAIGVNAAWVIVADTIAGSFILLALSGLTLWSRLEVRRAAGLSIVAVPLALAIGTLAY